MPLSREHHAALSLARRIHKHADDLPELAALAQQLRDGTAELLAHFAQEESLFLPDMLELHPTLCQQLCDEHLHLRAYLARVSQGDHDCMFEFATLLIAHVRFEERELFPAFERSVV